MSFDCVFFDLDGTLTDSAPGIIGGVKYALEKLNARALPQETLRCFIGPTLDYSFRVFGGLSDAKAGSAVKYYREYYEDRGMLENRLYDGIDDMLCSLSKSGCKIALATSKPEKYAFAILEHFGIMRYFDYTVGALTNAGGRSTKDEVISYALELSGANPQKSAMVGDRSYDMLGAKRFMLTAIGALYGYGDEKELHESGADIIAGSVGELKSILLGEVK